MDVNGLEVDDVRSLVVNPLDEVVGFLVVFLGVKEIEVVVFKLEVVVRGTVVVLMFVVVFTKGVVVLNVVVDLVVDKVVALVTPPHPQYIFVK